MSCEAVLNEERLDERRDLENALFQADTTLPYEYLQTVRRRAELEPERNPMLAVLEDAVASF